MPASHWGSRGAAVDPRGGGGGGVGGGDEGARRCALEGSPALCASTARRDFMPTQLPFSPLFFLLTWPVIAYRLFTHGTRRCTATVVHLPSSPPPPPHFLALLRRLISPRTAPSLAACLPSSPFFRFSPPSVLTPDSSSSFPPPPSTLFV